MISASGEVGAGDTEAEEFETARAVVDEMAAAGLECADFKRLDATQESLADFGLCFLGGDRTYETDIYVTTSPDHVQGWADSFAQYENIYVLSGGNWLITNGSVEQLEQISDAIGGTLATK